MTTHAPRQTVKELLASLHATFGTNVDAIESDASLVFDSIDLNSRIVSEIRTILLDEYCESDCQTEICAEILDEIFTDFTLAMYLFSIGLIVPARMSVRRAFELGLASVYMWDLPHEYWGWRQRDQDLSFSNMVSHLNSAGYLAHLAHTHGGSHAASICDQAKFQLFYRELSNTVHGKLNGLPPLSPERFATEKNGQVLHLKLMIDVQAEIIRLLFGRFPGLKTKIEKIFPQTNRP